MVGMMMIIIIIHDFSKIFEHCPLSPRLDGPGTVQLMSHQPSTDA